MAEENVNINVRVRGADQAARDAKKLGDAIETTGKKAATAGNQFTKATKQFREGGRDLKRVFSALSGAAIGAGIGGIGAMGFRAIGSLASLPVFGMKEYQTGQMGGLKAGLGGFAAGGMGGALAGGSLGGMLGGAIGSALMPGVGTVLGGALGGLGGAALGGGAGSIIGALGAMFTEATAKAQPFMDALLRMSDALKPLMDALVGFANALAPAFDACYPAILGLSELLAQLVNTITGPAVGAINTFAEVFAVAFGILGDQAQTWDTKFVDMFQLAVRAIAGILDTVFIPIWNKMLEIIAKMTGDIMGGIANTIVNSIIGAVNNVINGLRGLSFGGQTYELFGKKISIPKIAPFSSIGNLGTVDLRDFASQWVSGMTDQYKLPEGGFNTLLDQLGVSSIGDLASKYNVDLNARGSAQKLVEALKDNTTAVKGMKESMQSMKESMQNFKAEVYVNQHFNGPVTKEDLETANMEVYKAIDKAFSARGVGA
jgi:hypothetical protein